METLINTMGIITNNFPTYLVINHDGTDYYTINGDGQNHGEIKTTLKDLYFKATQ